MDDKGKGWIERHRAEEFQQSKEQRGGSTISVGAMSGISA
jgi:hypothetical protein